MTEPYENGGFIQPGWTRFGNFQELLDDLYGESFLTKDQIDELLKEDDDEGSS